jgi:hypothetical protein
VPAGQPDRVGFVTQLRDLRVRRSCRRVCSSTDFGNVCSSALRAAGGQFLRLAGSRFSLCQKSLGAFNSAMPRVCRKWSSSAGAMAHPLPQGSAVTFQNCVTGITKGNFKRAWRGRDFDTSGEPHKVVRVRQRKGFIEIINIQMRRPSTSRPYRNYRRANRRPPEQGAPFVWTS